MCGNGSDKSKGGSKGAPAGSFDWAKSMGMVNAVGDFDPAGAARESNRGAMGGGGKSSLGANGTTSLGTQAPGKMGEVTGVQSPATGALMSRPTARSSFQSAYGPTGIEATKETEEAFGGSSLNPFDGATISTSDDFGWDFTKGRTTGTVKATANRNVGAIRDGIAKAVGSPYDRDITPNRAKDMLSKGTGTLSTWTKGLSQGNYQYDEDGKPAIDRLGMAIDLFSPVGRAMMGDVAGTLTGSVTALDTAMTHSKLENAGVFGTPTKHTPTKQQRASVKTPNLTGHLSGSFGNSGNPETLLYPSPQTSQKPVTNIPSTDTTMMSKKPRRGKSSLNKTGSQGLSGKPGILMQKLWGTEEKKRKQILMQHSYK